MPTGSAAVGEPEPRDDGMGLIGAAERSPPTRDVDSLTGAMDARHDRT